jgi:hypothetical protein
MVHEFIIKKKQAEIRRYLVTSFNVTPKPEIQGDSSQKNSYVVGIRGRRPRLPIINNLS